MEDIINPDPYQLTNLDSLKNIREWRYKRMKEIIDYMGIDMKLQDAVNKLAVNVMECGDCTHSFSLYYRETAERKKEYDDLHKRFTYERIGNACRLFVKNIEKSANTVVEFDYSMKRIDFKLSIDRELFE